MEVTENFNSSSSELKDEENEFDEKILKMMERMGYKKGTGLGKLKQGPLEPLKVILQIGKRGLGHTCSNLNLRDVIEWNSSHEKINIKEEVIWLESHLKENLRYKTMKTWLTVAPLKYSIENEVNFCDPNLLQSIINEKNIFNELDSMDLMKARARANPFETLKSAFFMNRAALKMANIDAITDFMFTNVDKNPHHTKNRGPFYFADVCAGPGGFTEYILWRKKWMFKGFGFTLRNDNDFKVCNSNCASSATFQPLYGAMDDGNVCCPENIKHFSEKVLHETENKGVHFMMSDGGFSVEGNENLQEVLSKQLYACQCLVALEIVRTHGHFVSKLFDVFTTFSVGLVFLMHICFEKICILKPNTSRPANSERYLVCFGLKPLNVILPVRKYLRKTVHTFWNIKEKGPENDIHQIVPIDVINRHEEFLNYIIDSNNRLGKNQLNGLKKLAAFCRNPLLVEHQQELLRSQCLQFWRIPDHSKVLKTNIRVDDIKKFIDKPEFMLVNPRLFKYEDLPKIKKDLNNWTLVPMFSSKNVNTCGFYAGLSGSKLYKYNNLTWVKTKINLKLVEGTILYGELVKEYNVSEGFQEIETKCLHVVDALRLGDIALSDLSFNERRDLIETYCQAVNFETNENSVRIRVKPTFPVQSLISSEPISFNSNLNKYYIELPVLGYQHTKEYIHVASALLLKTDTSQSFRSTYVLRVQLLIEDKGNDNTNLCVNLLDFLNKIKSENVDL